MDYCALARELMQYMQQMRKFKHHRKLEDSLQGEEFLLLYVKHRQGEVTPGEISETMGISTARIAAVLNRLEEKGYISREIDKSDRRKIVVSLTSDGEKIALQHQQNHLKIASELLMQLGEQDAKEYVRIMGRLAEIASKRGGIPC